MSTPSSWKVFVVAKKQGTTDLSALGGDLTMTFDSTKKAFQFPAPIPSLTQSGSVWTGSDSNYTYTWKIYNSDPSSSQFFLGQITRGPLNGGAPDRYDTTLAIDTSILSTTISSYDGDVTIYAPAQRWLVGQYDGKITRNQSFIRVKDQDTQNYIIHFPLIYDQTTFPNSFWHNGHAAKGETRRLGGRYINMITTSPGTSSHVIFGHLHWSTDFFGSETPCGLDVPLGLGDKTEPFVAVTSPPPPDCGLS